MMQRDEQRLMWDGEGVLAEHECIVVAALQPGHASPSMSGGQGISAPSPGAPRLSRLPVLLLQFGLRLGRRVMPSANAPSAEPPPLVPVLSSSSLSLPHQEQSSSPLLLSSSSSSPSSSWVDVDRLSAS